jgi:Ca-activated chloride channel homolog
VARVLFRCTRLASPTSFQGEQLQLAGRYEGHGPATITIKGHAGDQLFSESFEANFPKIAEGDNFIAPIWARRKVGYLLDQIRQNGESVELRHELIRLARDFAIATPYTSLLVVPESASSADSGRRRPGSRRRRAFPALPAQGGGDFGGAAGGMFGGGMPRVSGMGGMGAGIGGGGMGGGMGGMAMRPAGGRSFDDAGGDDGAAPHAPERATTSTHQPRGARTGSSAATAPPARLASSGKEAIELAERVADLKAAMTAETPASHQAVGGRRFRKVGDAWVDQAFTASTPTLRLRVLGEAYFRLLAQHHELGPIFALGNRVTWVSPSGTAVEIDTEGQDEVPDATLDRLFARS